MQHHAAYGLTHEDLDVFIIEDSKPMLVMIRSILASLHPQRIRTFDRADAALEAMLTEPPNLIISDWRMKPMNGLQLLKTLRNQAMAPLCYVPVLIVTAHATREMAQKAFLAGAQQVLVKPISPSILIERINLVLHDPREMFSVGDSRISITGVGHALAEQEMRMEMLQRARLFHKAGIKHVEAQNAVDHLLGEDEPRPGNMGQPVPAKAPTKGPHPKKADPVGSSKTEALPAQKTGPQTHETKAAQDAPGQTRMEAPAVPPEKARIAPVVKPARTSPTMLLRHNVRASFGRITQPVK